MIALVADVESRGGATTYRFSDASVRRAFDAGWSAVEIKDFLQESSRTPVPQALDYLVDDVSRRFGTVRAGAAEAFLRSDDETALTELVSDPGAAGLRLRRIAPTVVVSDVASTCCCPGCASCGHAPVVEAADGSVRVARPDVFRSRMRPRRPAAVDRARLAARTSALVAAVRSGDRVAAHRPSGQRASLPGDILSLLRTAADDGADVWIGYVDRAGSRLERVVRPVRVEGGELVADDEGEARSFAVQRISEAQRV